ncbi:hypothetical protein LCGC14_1168680 [marine sediment metagenome]|uniref:Uncharacterized protein n=1 Tax=marine sediment metagenome TaxID=412755 RepID=A0A0F9LVD6_9ZZZZ
MEDICCCGHVEDEHECGGACTIEGCLCCGYEEE